MELTLETPGNPDALRLAQVEADWRTAETEYNNACATFRKHAEKNQECPLIVRNGSRANVLMAVASPETRRLRAVVVAALEKRNALIAQRADLRKKLGAR